MYNKFDHYLRAKTTAWTVAVTYYHGKVTGGKDNVSGTVTKVKVVNKSNYAVARSR